MTLITDPRCTEYRTVGHPEKPARISRSVDLLKSQKALDLRWIEPGIAGDASLLRAHTPAHLKRITENGDFDGDTAWHPGIDQHARRGAAGALKAMELARGKQPAFSLMRPPGHHATRSSAMGFCYLGSMAIAALDAAHAGERVAILDFDVHHGNGTEDIVAGKENVWFASVHQSPCYPGTGLADVSTNCFNYPTAPGTDRKAWMERIRTALRRLMEQKPTLIGVSAGFDAYHQDPLAQGTLEKEDFHKLGVWMRETGVPVFSVLEGGYSLDLPELILQYLLGLSGKE